MQVLRLYRPADLRRYPRMLSSEQSYSHPHRTQDRQLDALQHAGQHIWQRMSLAGVSAVWKGDEYIHTSVAVEYGEECVSTRRI
jgi:hypothetical protein